MGVPEFLKFVARSAPGALCRLPKHTDEQRPAATTLLEYDYVLVDATNAAQTIGIERLHEFLCHPRLIVHKAIVFALDAGRTREGTARHQRQAHLMVGDLDVKVQQLCASLTDLFRNRAVAEAKRTREEASHPHAPTQSQRLLQVPYVVMSGRNVAGEADYKVLDLQRVIVATALHAKESALPRFLFISEDSDILCGALCGPAPQNVSIATNLRDTMFELCILRLEHVLTYVAVCVDALVGGGEGEGEAAAAIGEDGPAQAKQDGREATAKGKKIADGGENPDEAKVAETEKRASEEAEANVVRRRKQDGPMVAAGKRVTLEDSSSDEENDNHAGGKDDGAPQGQAPSVAGEAQPSGSRSHTTGGAGSALARLAPFDVAAGKMIHGSCVDLVFLFVVVMGNGVNVPPLVRGVTRVDIASCWQAYCKHKFTAEGIPGGGGFITSEEKEMGRTLLSTTPTVTAGGKEESARAFLSLNCRFLLSILESVHYADAQSRPPVEEEKNRAMAYLSNAVYATLRYIVACNVNAGPALEETFLDSRPLSETEVLVPSLAAVLWMLGQNATQRFSYPLHGLAKKELLALQGHAPAPTVRTAPVNTTKLASRDDSATNRNTAKPSLSSMVMNVGDALVSPPAASTSAASWAMARSGGGSGGGQAVSRTYTLGHIIACPNTLSLLNSNAAPMRGGVRGVAGAADADASCANVGSLARSYCREMQRSQSSLSKNTFAALCETFRCSVALAVPQLRSIAQKSLFMSPVTGNVVEGPLAAGEVSVELGKSRGVGDAVEAAGKAASTKLVYSFELRRMTPLLTTAAGVPPTGNGRSAEQETHPRAATSPSSAAPSSASSVQAALQAALGLSLDYAKPPPAPANVVVDPKELKLVNPSKHLKKQQRRVKEDSGNAPEKNSADEPPAKLAKGEGEEAGEAGKRKYHRPGKKERKRLQWERKQQQQQRGGDEARAATTGATTTSSAPETDE